MATTRDAICQKYNFKDIRVASWRDPFGPRSQGQTVSPEAYQKPFMPKYRYILPSPKIPQATDDEDSDAGDNAPNQPTSVAPQQNTNDSLATTKPVAEPPALSEAIPDESTIPASPIDDVVASSASQEPSESATIAPATLDPLPSLDDIISGLGSFPTTVPAEDRAEDDSAAQLPPDMSEEPVASNTSDSVFPEQVDESANKKSDEVEATTTVEPAKDETPAGEEVHPVSTEAAGAGDPPTSHQGASISQELLDAILSEIPAPEGNTGESVEYETANAKDIAAGSSAAEVLPEAAQSMEVPEPETSLVVPDQGTDAVADAIPPLDTGLIALMDAALGPAPVQTTGQATDNDAIPTTPVADTISLNSDDKHVSFAPNTPEPKETKRKKKNTNKEGKKNKRRSSLSAVDLSLDVLADLTPEISTTESVPVPPPPPIPSDEAVEPGAPATPSPIVDNTVPESEAITEVIDDKPEPVVAKEPQEKVPDVTSSKKANSGKSKSSAKSIGIFAAGAMLVRPSKSKSSKSSNKEKEKDRGKKRDAESKRKSNSSKSKSGPSPVGEEEAAPKDNEATPKSIDATHETTEAAPVTTEAALENTEATTEMTKEALESTETTPETTEAAPVTTEAALENTEATMEMTKEALESTDTTPETTEALSRTATASADPQTDSPPLDALIPADMAEDVSQSLAPGEEILAGLGITVPSKADETENTHVQENIDSTELALQDVATDSLLDDVLKDLGKPLKAQEAPESIAVNDQVIGEQPQLTASPEEEETVEVANKNMDAVEQDASANIDAAETAIASDALDGGQDESKAIDAPDHADAPSNSETPTDEVATTKEESDEAPVSNQNPVHLDDNADIAVATCLCQDQQSEVLEPDTTDLGIDEDTAPPTDSIAVEAKGVSTEDIPDGVHSPELDAETKEISPAVAATEDLDTSSTAVNDQNEQISQEALILNDVVKQDEDSKHHSSAPEASGHDVTGEEQAEISIVQDAGSTTLVSKADHSLDATTEETMEALVETAAPIEKDPVPLMPSTEVDPGKPAEVVHEESAMQSPDEAIVTIESGEPVIVQEDKAPVQTSNDSPPSVVEAETGAEDDQPPTAIEIAEVAIQYSDSTAADAEPEPITDPAPEHPAPESVSAKPIEDILATDPSEGQEGLSEVITPPAVVDSHDTVTEVASEIVTEVVDPPVESEPAASPVVEESIPLEPAPEPSTSIPEVATSTAPKEDHKKVDDNEQKQPSAPPSPTLSKDSGKRRDYWSRPASSRKNTADSPEQARSVQSSHRSDEQRRRHSYREVLSPAEEEDRRRRRRARREAKDSKYEADNRQREEEQARRERHEARRAARTAEEDRSERGSERPHRHRRSSDRPLTRDDDDYRTQTVVPPLLRRFTGSSSVSRPGLPLRTDSGRRSYDNDEVYSPRSTRSHRRERRDSVVSKKTSPVVAEMPEAPIIEEVAPPSQAGSRSKATDATRNNEAGGERRRRRHGERRDEQQSDRARRARDGRDEGERSHHRRRKESDRNDPPPATISTKRGLLSTLFGLSR